MRTQTRWRVTEHGGNEVLNFEKGVSIPDPDTGEIRVKVLRVGLNHLDLWVRKGVPGHKFPLPLVPGCEIVGLVDSIGALSPQAFRELTERGISVGSRVMIHAVSSCGACSQCQGGLQPLCRNFGLFGETRDGGLAEYVSVPVRNLVLIPAGVTLEEAASVPVAGVTAYSMLTRKISSRPGQSLLIRGGGSSVNLWSLAIARDLGLMVAITTRNLSNAKFLRDAGADHVIDNSTETLKSFAKEHFFPTGLSGFDYALDHVGAATFSQTLKVLAWGGTLLTCGATTGADIQIDLKQIFFKNLSIVGSTMGNFSDAVALLRLIERKQMSPILDNIFEYSQLPEALDRLEQGEAFGKIIVKVANE